MNLISRLIDRQTPFVFISPHLDDAILSCGGLISYIRNNIPIKVISVFTEISEEPKTKFARHFVKSCGYQNSRQLFKDRQNEDAAIFRKLNIKYGHLGFNDAAWRKNKDNTTLPMIAKYFPEFVHIYPRQKDIFSGKVAAADVKTVITVENILKSLIGKNKKTVILAPVGIGLHVDHIMIRDICAKNFHRVIFWSDFHYSLFKSADEDFIKKKKLKLFSWNKNIKYKEKLIRTYKSQFSSLFPTGKVPEKDEIFFFNEADFQNL